MGNEDQSRTWFRSYADLKAFDSLRAPVWVFDVDRHTMWWGNPSAFKFWSVSSLKELLARDFSTDSEVVRRRLRQIVENPQGPESAQETWTLFPHGTPTTVILDFKPILIDDGRHAVLIEASYPIQLDRDPEALRILEAARNTPLMVSTFSLEGLLLARNPAATACYRRQPGPGVAGDQNLGDRFIEADVVEQIREAVAADRHLQLDTEVETVDGRRFHRIAVRRGRDPISGETAIVLTEEDITDRIELEQDLARANRDLEERVAARTKDLVELNRRITEESDRRARSESALRDQFAFLQTLIDTIPAPIFYKDTDGRYLGFNKAFQELVRCRGEDIIGATAEEMASEGALEHHVQADRDLLARGGGIQIYESSALGPQDERRDVVFYKGTTRHGDGSIAGIAGVVFDVTDLKRAEQQLRDVQRLEAIGKLTGGVAHDFNNLLTVILGNLELLSITVEGDPEAEKLAVAALRAVDRGAKLTGQLLAYARNQPLSPVSLDINRFVSELAELMARTLGESIEVVTELGADLPPALADLSQLQNAILNLSLNARDALGPAGGRLTIASGWARVEKTDRGGSEGVEPDGLEPGDYLTIAVKDSGSGMPAEVLERATEPFFSTKGFGEGSGLGLSMAYGFASQSGGTLKIESRAGKGTEVTLFLPSSAKLDDATEVVPGAAAEASREARILVVEDDPEVRAFMTASLEKMGYVVVSEANGVEAIDRLRSDRAFDLLFTDVMLPGGLSGRDVAEQASRFIPGVKILFTSGYSKDELDHDGRLDLGLELLTKPYRQKDLADALSRVLG